MSKRVFSAITFILLLTSILTLAFSIQPVKASGTIYIRADGSIDPPTAPISTVDNVTYTLTGNITSDADGIVVERGNIVVDGAGYTFQGTGDIESTGIGLSSRTNVTVMNTKITTWSYGIYLDYSSNNSISGNTVTGNNFPGICLQHDCSNNSISGNNIANTGSGIALGGSCNYNSISGNNIANSTTGIGLGSSSNCNSISGNNITGISETIRNYNYNYGIELWGSLNNSITGNNITANKWSGIRLGFSSNNRIYHNNFVGNAKQVDSADSVNVWDDGYPSGGNYWSDYTGGDVKKGPDQNETGSDGIGDTSYVIDENNRDRYPLFLTVSALPQMGVKAGDWTKYDYTITGWPAGTPYPKWLKVEFLSVEGTTATARVTMHLSDETEQNATVPVDVVAGGQAFGLSGFVSPANLTIGDPVYMTGYGSVTIGGETASSYAGASRTVVYASFSQYGTQLTYYWDKLTGVMVEASVVSGGVTATGKATETNMWQAGPSGLPIDPIYLYVLAALVIVIAVGAAAFIVRRRKRPPEDESPQT